MKTRIAAVLALLPVPFLTAAPRIVVSTPSLAPESSIDLVLDLPAVTSADIGKTVDNEWLKIRPELPVKLRWKSPTIAEVLLQEAPMMGATYTFEIADGRKSIDGSMLTPGLIATVPSERFKIVSCNPLEYRWSDSFSTSSTAWITAFNDTVDARTIADRFQFVSASDQRVAAKVEPCTVSRAGDYGSEPRIWSERWNASPEIKRNPEDIAPNVVLVRPLTPLPPDKEWKLIVAKGLPNTSGTARLSETIGIAVGDVEPMQVTKTTAVVEVDQPRRIQIQFNRPLAEDATGLGEWINIEPDPGPIGIRTNKRTLILSGEFAPDKPYNVRILPQFSSAAGERLQKEHLTDVRFKMLDPMLTLPTFDSGQLAHGRRQYPLYAVNLESFTLCIKKPVGADLIRAFQGYRHYTGADQPQSPLPWPLVVGPTLAERTVPLDSAIDTSKTVDIAWDEWLPEGTRHGVFFLEASGKPRAELQTGEYRTTQAIIQLTDIGLAWKMSRNELIVHAFSCETGRPLTGLKIERYGDEAAHLDQALTDDTGTAVLTQRKDARHIMATLGDDTFVTRIDSSMENIDLWYFPVRQSWLPPAESNRQAFLFSDRSLYRPGETVRIKGILRQLRGNQVEPHAEGAADMVVKDPADREIARVPVRISANGSFDFSHQLARTKTGSHRVILEFPDELKLAENQNLPWAERERIESDAQFDIEVRVEHFRRSAFEITQKIATPEVGATSISTTIHANYFQGQPVAAGKVKHHSRIDRINPYPERFRDFLFGDHREEDPGYWRHYFGFDADEFDETRSAEHRHDETALGADGSGKIEIPVPDSGVPTLRKITLHTEVTDANLQTLSTRSETIIHPASACIGVSRIDRLVRIGEDLELRLVAADPDGKPFHEALALTAELTREVNTPVKTESPDGATTIRNDRTEEPVSRTDLTLDPAASARDGQALILKPQAPGLHFLTIRGNDPQGRPFVTVSRFHVYGSEQFPWKYEDGMKIRLVGEKKSWKPGETARVLVLSPIEGSAWITIEREKVLRQFRTELRADRPVIEIPLTTDDAPNVYLSVLVIKGSTESAREIKEPQVRLGYCELLVENTHDKLNVSIDNGAESHRPGDEVVMTGRVTLPDGSPAAGAEVTLYAEDEGVLAVMGYDTPDPMAHFHQPRLLHVDSGVSFESFMPEDPKLMEFVNKGYFAGGAADLGKLADLMRKNFDPCATWAPCLITAADGSFSHRFKLPDTLTRYRVIAVAHHQASRFGTGESSITARKELMLEPKTPRFASKSDQIENRLLVQNASRHAGTWDITFRAHDSSGTPVCEASGTTTHTLSLAPGASATLAFPVLARSTGEAVLSWTAVPTALDLGNITPELARQFGDAVESRFQVIHPMPELREMKWLPLDASSDKPLDLCRTLDPQLLAGEASVELTLSISPLAAAGAAVDFLLGYPHGCAEQTASALIPWCFSSELRGIAPAFTNADEQRIRNAIQTGADRLLALQRTDGSFSYWPDGEFADWATPHAAFALTLAKSKGASVPQAALKSMNQHLMESLRGMAETESAASLETMAYSLFVLAQNGNPQAAYHDTMAKNLSRLTREARCFLAAAIATADPQHADTAKSVLRSSILFTGKDDRWMSQPASLALESIAWSSIDPRAPEALRSLDRLLLDRNRLGHWDDTWKNGLAILAVAMQADDPSLKHQPRTVRIESTDGTQTIVTLDDDSPVATLRFDASADMKLLASTAGGPAYARVNLRSLPEIALRRASSSNGLAIDRIHYRIGADGSLTPLTEPKTGDLVRVLLRVTLPDDDSRHLVVEDRLPATFEAIDESFNSQKTAIADSGSRDWEIGYRELRNEGAVFFIDRAARRGTYTVSYLARCTLAGEANAAPAKVESMYDPGKNALSASRNFTTPTP